MRLRPYGAPSGPNTFGSSRVSSRSDCALPSKPPMSLRPLVERPLAVVPERRMSEVVGEAGGVDDVGSEAEAAGELAADLRDLERVGEPVAGEVEPGGRRLSTWVLAARRRSALECSSRARSRAKSLRRVECSSGSHRSRSASP